MENSKAKAGIDELLTQYEVMKDNLFIIIVTNVNREEYTDDFGLLEYYALEQHNDVRRAIHKLGINLKSYFNEKDFINDYLNSVIRNHHPKDILVINVSKKGSTNQYDLLSTFCEVNHIMYTSCYSSTILLLHNKLLRHKDYSAHVCPNWLYTQSGWDFDKKPTKGTKVIVKLCNETSNIAIIRNRIFIYENDIVIKQLFRTIHSNLIIEAYITGEKVVVTILLSKQKIIVLSPSGIRINEDTSILDSYINNPKEYYCYLNKYPGFSEEIIKLAKELAINSKINGFVNFKFIVQEDGSFYLLNIEHNPNIYSRNNSIVWNYKNLGYEYLDMIKTHIALAVLNDNLEEIING